MRNSQFFVLLFTSLVNVACSNNDDTNIFQNEENSTGIESDIQTSTNAEDDTAYKPSDTFIESYLPATEEPQSINQMIHLVFQSSTMPGDHIVQDSVSLLINGEPARAWNYYKDNKENREFRYVPFPVWQPNTSYTITIQAGVTYAISGDTMNEDFVFEFITQDHPFNESYSDNYTTDLNDDELAILDKGAVFSRANIVTNWRDEDSSLYEISQPVYPSDERVIALARKLENSLLGLLATGLAAPQIGINRRVFSALINNRPTTYINPVIVDYSEDFRYFSSSTEACLSIANINARVARPTWIEIEYDNKKGEHIAGIIYRNDNAAIWMHEYDHLNGVLITDRQESKFPPPNQSEI